MQSKQTLQNNAKPRKVWWLVGVLLLAVCVLIQMPASWLIQKFLPNNTYIQQVSGNLWQGAAIVQLPSTGKNNRASADSVANVIWHWQPLALLTAKLGADIEIISGQTKLQGELRRGFNTWQLKEVSGRVDRQTLTNVMDWQLPDAPIVINDLSMAYSKDKGFDDVDGQLTWVGGELGYPNAGKMLKITLPAMRADILQETRDDGEVIHANLVDNNSQRLGDFYLDDKGMLDVSLTQRLLENMPSYKGSAPADTAVVTVRQPLISGMGTVNSNTANSNANHIDNQNTDASLTPTGSK